MRYVKAIVNWIETGDLIPAILLVSIPHYVDVLSGYDYVYVAVAIGFLLDIGHYRSIKLAMRGGSWWWAAVMTVGVFGFHVWFYSIREAGYGAILLGAAPVMLIAFLAYLTRKEKLDTKLARSMRPKDSPDESHETPSGNLNNSIGTYQDYLRLNMGRNGEGAISARELIETYSVPKSTAYRWYSQYARQGNGDETTGAEQKER